MLELPAGEAFAGNAVGMIVDAVPGLVVGILAVDAPDGQPELKPLLAETDKLDMAF